MVTANRLINMDWSFGVTTSSSDANQVGKTYIQLKLVVEEKEHTSRRTDFVELSVDQFYGALQSCKQYLDYVSTPGLSS